MGLERNPSLRVERLRTDLFRTFEDEERAAFDPTLGAEGSWSRTRAQRLARAGSGTERPVNERATGAVSVEEFLPTGTTIDLEARAETTKSSLYSAPLTATRLGLTATQSLLRGFGLGPNLASLRQARLDTLASEYELRGFAEALVAETEGTYWDFVLAQRQVEIFGQSVELAERQLAESQERIWIGKLAETELAASQAEVARRREALINARSDLAKTRLHLLRLLNPQGPDPWDREIVLRDRPEDFETALDDVRSHVEVALRLRPDLNEARLRLRRGDLEIVKTRNGLLPKLDVFVTLGKTGYAESLGPSIEDLDGKGYDIMIGGSLEFPFGNRAPRARHERALLDRRQAEEALENLTQLIQVDVRSAHIEVARAREQVTATAATRRLQEESLRAETEKFRVGNSTTFLVAQAQRDLVVSQIAEVQAVVTLLKDLVDLYRLDGSLLARRGIEAPGRETIPAPEDRDR
ncbi:MAG: TolC family protein [Planctomycetes bacterium]|nr:TolC family protein [Planctomycetota bacterium]